MTSNQAKYPETQLAQALGWIDEATGALVPPSNEERRVDLVDPADMNGLRDVLRSGETKWV